MDDHTRRAGPRRAPRRRPGPAVRVKKQSQRRGRAAKSGEALGLRRLAIVNGPRRSGDEGESRIGGAHGEAKSQSISRRDRRRPPGKAGQTGVPAGRRVVVPDHVSGTPGVRSRSPGCADRRHEVRHAVVGGRPGASRQIVDRASSECTQEGHGNFGADGGARDKNSGSPYRGGRRLGRGGCPRIHGVRGDVTERGRKESRVPPGAAPCRRPAQHQRRLPPSSRCSTDQALHANTAYLESDADDDPRAGRVSGRPSAGSPERLPGKRGCRTPRAQPPLSDLPGPWRRKPKVPPGRQALGVPLSQHLLAQDVGVSCVLSKLTQHLQIQRPHRMLASTVHNDRKVRLSDCVSGSFRPGPVDRRDRRHGVGLGQGEGAVGVVAIPISAYERPVSAWSNQTPSIQVTCLTSPRMVVFEGTRCARASSSDKPCRASSRAFRYSSRSSSSRRLHVLGPPGGVSTRTHPSIVETKLRSRTGLTKAVTGEPACAPEDDRRARTRTRRPSRGLAASRSGIRWVG